MTTRRKSRRRITSKSQHTSHNITDVAREAGVSITTVSRVINRVSTVSGDNRRRVEQAIRQLKYRPNRAAQRLAAGRSNTISLIIPRFEGVFQSYYALEAIRGIGSAVERLRLDLLLHVMDGPEAINTSSSEGVLFMDIDGNEETLDVCIQQGIPSVVMNHYIKELPVSCVAVDNREAAEQVVDFLVGLGHRDIAVVTGDLGIQAGLDRYDGFVRGLRRHDISLRRDYVSYAQFSPKMAEEATRRLIALSHRPTAIFAASDEMALSVMQVVLDNGLRVPEDISIIGFDDNPIAQHARIPLTTVRQPLSRMGDEAVELLYSHMRNQRVKPAKRILPTELVERQSCRQTWLQP